MKTSVIFGIAMVTIGTFATSYFWPTDGKIRAPVAAQIPKLNPNAVADSTPEITTTKRLYTQLSVPFTSQAPSGQWSDSRFQNACEEASVIMAIAWLRNEKILTSSFVESEILRLVAHQVKQYGTHKDTSAEDTAKRLLDEFYGYTSITTDTRASTEKIKNAILNGHLVIVPLNGRVLRNPHYQTPGPERHMLVITGYDEVKGEFITHDPGTRFGENYRYTEAILESSLADYETGNDTPLKESRKSMIIVKR